MAQQLERQRRLPVLDGVRLVAIAWVILGEAVSAAFHPRPPPRSTFIASVQYTLNADLAYDLLLLVSGVVMTSLVLAEVERTGGLNVRAFLFRRWLALWPALALGLAATVALLPSMRPACAAEWWAVLLFVNNYFGDLQCMPQTWLVAVLAQLYLLTPALIYLCVNYQTRTLRQNMSSYILLLFLSASSIFASWLFYEIWGDSFVYRPQKWPPGPYFKAVALRWSPYLAGVALALLKWDSSSAVEDERSARIKRAEGMPIHERIAERQPISCTDVTRAMLDALADLLCLLLLLWITLQGTQQSVAFLSLILRVIYAWTAARLLYRLLCGAWKPLGRVLSLPIAYTGCQLAFPALIIQSVVYFDVRGMLGLPHNVAWEPFTQAAGLVAIAFLLFIAAYAMGGYAVYLILHKPMLNIRPARQADLPPPPEAANSAPPPSDIPWPLQRHKSRESIQGISSACAGFGSLPEQSVRAVHETAVTVLSGTHSELRVFPNHFVPERGTTYFDGGQPAPETPDGYWVLTVVTAYNEGGEEMADTLISLHEQAKHLPKGQRLHVLMVFDGWNKMSSSMRSYLQRLYPGAEAEQVRAVEQQQMGGASRRSLPRWMDAIDSTQLADWYTAALPVTYTLQQQDGEGVVPVSIAPGRDMMVSALVKFDNRRKHNSHEWYLRTFGKQYPSRYMYLTDVGTTADRFCLPRLVSYMDVNPDYVAVTGFQRVQRLRRGSTLVQHLQREVQAYELGPGMCHNVKASQGFMGFQLILCGPCQMVRSCDALQEPFLDAFFDMINKDSVESGILHANLALTEDMAFGCYLYAMTPNKKTGYVPDAYFDYDVETAPDRLLKQRRRWNNGIVAGIHYLINPFGQLWGLSTKPWHLKLCNLLVMCQQYILVMTLLVLPSVYMFNIFTALGGFTANQYGPRALSHPLNPVYWDYLAPGAAVLPALGVLAYFAILTFWTFIHRRREYVAWLYMVMLVVNVTIGLVTTAFIANFFSEVSALHGRWMGITVTALYSATLLCPMISSAALGDTYGLLVSVVNVPLMLAFLPMWLFLGAYSLARFADFTWGNRPHESESQDGAKRDAHMRKCRTVGLLIALAYLGGNLLLACGLIALGFVWDGNAVAIFLVLAVPYSLSSVAGCLFNIQYALRYRWIPAIRAALGCDPPSTPAPSTSYPAAAPHCA